MTVLFTQEAKVQIRAIRAYSSHRWGKEVADLYARALRATITSTLDQRPSPGRDRSGDLAAGVRSFPCESHIIYYREVATGIEILAVLHQSQDPVRHL